MNCQHMCMVYHILTSCVTVDHLGNQISDHQMIFFSTKMELVKLRNKKYVEIERYWDERVRLVVQEIERYNKYIYSQLDKIIVSDPTKNFDSVSRRIIEIEK